MDWALLCKGWMVECRGRAVVRRCVGKDVSALRQRAPAPLSKAAGAFLGASKPTWQLGRAICAARHQVYAHLC